MPSSFLSASFSLVKTAVSLSDNSVSFRAISFSFFSMDTFSSKQFQEPSKLDIMSNQLGQPSKSFSQKKLEIPKFKFSPPEYIAGKYGKTQEEINLAKPSVKEIVSALSKYPANIAYGLLDLFIPESEKKGRTGAEVFGVDVEAKTAGKAKVMQLTDIATLVPAGIMGGLKKLTPTAAKIVEDLYKNKASKKIIEKVIKYGDNFLENLNEKEAKEYLDFLKPKTGLLDKSKQIKPPLKKGILQVAREEKLAKEAKSTEAGLNKIKSSSELPTGVAPKQIPKSPQVFQKDISYLDGITKKKKVKSA